MSCNTCKKKKGNNIKHLSKTTVTDELKTAYEYVSIASKMNNEKWAFVDEVLQEYYPGRHKTNTGCKDCVRATAKLVEYLYNKN
jgi:hypothetical protein